PPASQAPSALAAPAMPPPAPRILRIRVAPREAASNAQPAGSPKAVHTGGAKPAEARTISTFLPVSFTRGTLLGGLDAPTGGQAQSNPHPVLIRLSDISVLPNRMRGEYRECFVVAAGYGDISSERAYLRTESLSCVRADGATLEVRIQGSIYGEDGKVGLRGRLITKQGQMLANALLAGVASGIGQGLATSSTNYSTSALGSVATSSGSDALRAGLGTGVGRALDRLAQYYIRLAENTFPVIEIDAGREIDVVITKGARIDTSMTAPPATAQRAGLSPANRYLEVSDDPNY
ncbi:MAG: TraB/VirB10 family protein, partial [Desulfovibrionaceae bacterium]|nr:TraB/VirB10 family protein [Desulfovibrionaceae bacterium]